MRKGRPNPAKEPSSLGDSGVQIERTSLAWRRTLAGFLVVGAVGIRILPHMASLPTTAWIVLVATAAVVLLVTALSRNVVSGRRRVSTQATGTVYLADSAGPFIATLSAATGLLGTVAILLVIC